MASKLQNCKMLIYEQVHAQDIKNNMTAFNVNRHQNLLGDPFNITRDSDVSRMGIVQQAGTLKINTEGQLLAFKNIVSDVTSSDVIAAFPHKLLDKEVIRNWRKDNQVPADMMKQSRAR